MKKVFLFFLILFSTHSLAQEMHVINANYIPQPDTILIFKPKNYSNNKNFPLVILLHGWSGTYKHWNELTGGLQIYSDRFGFIIACPDGFYDSWYLDSPIKENSKIETFFVNDLIPGITNKYKVDKKNIFITGLSMGGHGAMLMFLKHQDIFKSAGSLSGILDITEFPNRWSMLNALGKIEEYPENWKSNSVYNLLDKLKGTDKQILFECGTEDFAYNVNKKFYEKCLQSKIKATFISKPGNHNADFWKNGIENHFIFFYSQVE